MAKAIEECSWKYVSLRVLIYTLVLLASSAPRTPRAQTTTMDTGIDEAEVIQTSATVERIDLEKRKVTLLFDDGKHKTVKVDKSVQNLDQVKVGDHLKISFTEEIVMVVGKTNETPAAAAGQQVGVAPKGAKPGIVMVDCSALSAKVLAVDATKHHVTLEQPDGKKKTLKLGKKVTNLDQLKVGESVDMVVTDSVIVEVVK